MKTFAPDELESAVQLLKGGGVLMYPTETSYAIGCDATNADAVARVFAIKGRPEGKGTPIILPPTASPEQFIEMSSKAHELAQRFWPGPLNIVARRAERSPVSTRCETDGSQSVRKSVHPIATKLAALLDRPLVATSANRSGEAAVYSLKAIEEAFQSEPLPDGLVDGGDLPEVPSSTTVRVTADAVEILRQGGIVL